MVSHARMRAPDTVGGPYATSHPTPSVREAAGRCGFTVAEMVLSVAVVGMLAALVMGGSRESVEGAFVAAMKNDLRNYAHAQAVHRERAGRYAPTHEQLAEHGWTEGVWVKAEKAQAGRWFLVLGHDRTDTYCWMKYGVPTDADGRLRCGPNPPPTPNPSAQFTANPAPVMNTLATTFRASDPVAAGGLSRYEWTLGPGAGASGREVRHTYETLGWRAVTLTVTDPEGWRASRTDSVEIKEQWLVAPEDLTHAAWSKVGGTTVSGDVVHFPTANSAIEQSVSGTPEPDDNGDAVTNTFALTDGFRTYEVVNSSGIDMAHFLVRARGVAGTEFQMRLDWNRACSVCALEDLRVNVSPLQGGAPLEMEIAFMAAYFE